MNLQHELLSIQEEQELIKCVQKGNIAAQEKLLHHNERLIYYVASKYIRGAAPDISIDDLMQEGRIGLLHAAKKWSPVIAKNRGVKKFSTYASWWIYQYIRRYASHHRSGFSRSVELDDMSFAVHRVQSDLMESLRRNPTHEEIARTCDLPVSKVRAILSTPAMVRLDEIHSITGSSRHDSIPDPNINIPGNAETRVMALMYIENLEEEYPRHAKVIRMLFGLNEGQRIYSMAEIARKMKITRERVRQIREEAFELLRS